MNEWFKNFFCYLDRFYAKHHSLPYLKQVGLQHFKTEIYDNFKEDATSIIISLINEEREGGIVDVTLIKSMVELHESMGMGSIETYTSDLKTPLLEATQVYYEHKRIVDWKDMDNVSLLIKLVETLAKEKARVQEYLNPATESKILEVAEAAILREDFPFISLKQYFV